jgi:hypothetical protein
LIGSNLPKSTERAKSEVNHLHALQATTTALTFLLMQNSGHSMRRLTYKGRFRSELWDYRWYTVAGVAYVDLNPIRAAMAEILEQSDYTSIQECINQPDNDCLMAFGDQANNSIP